MTMPELTPDAWAQIRHAYENTDEPLAHICAAHEVSIPTVRYRMKKWNWQRRRPAVPQEGPAALPLPLLHPPLEGEGRRAASEARCEPGWGDDRMQQLHPTPPAFADAAAGDPPPPGEGKEEEIVPRLQRAVARVLPAIEAIIARLAAGPQHPREMEQAGRALSSLTRTLRELNTLLAQHNAGGGLHDKDDDDMPKDLDAFRIDLARRIDAFCASREALEAAKQEQS